MKLLIHSQISVEVWEWISDFIPHLRVHVINYQLPIKINTWYVKHHVKSTVTPVCEHFMQHGFIRSHLAYSISIQFCIQSIDCNGGTQNICGILWVLYFGENSSWLNHCGLMMPYDVLCDHWFRLWLNTCLMLSHCHNQCWFMISLILGDKSHEISIKIRPK